MVNAWLAGDGEKLRSWLVARTPDLLHGMIESLPLWAVAVLGCLVFIAGLWAVIQIFQGAVAFIQFLWGLATRPFTTTRETFVPSEKARKTEVDALHGKVAAQGGLIAEQHTLLAQMKAQLDRMEAAHVAAGAAPLGADERARRNTAIEGLASEGAPASEAAAQQIAKGDVAGAIEILERDARADAGAAADKWRRIGALVIGVDTAKARMAFEEAFRLQPDDFWTGIQLARLRRDAGDLDGARRAAEAVHAAADDDWERSVAADEMGDILVEGGDLDGAIGYFKTSLEIRKRITQTRQQSAEMQRGLGISHSKLGLAFLHAGHSDEAIAQFRAAMSITRHLLKDNAASVELQRDLAIIYGQIGEARLEAGNLDGAAQQFRLALEVSERLANEHSASELLQYDLALCLERLADISTNAENFAQAEKYYEAALEVSQRLARNDPGSALAQRNLARQRACLGDLLLITRDFPAAQHQYEQALAAIEPLARGNPGSVYFQRNLGALLEGLADVLIELGDRAAAIESMRRSHAIAEALALSNPGRADFREDAQSSKTRLRELEAGD